MIVVSCDKEIRDLQGQGLGIAIRIYARQHSVNGFLKFVGLCEEYSRWQSFARGPVEAIHRVGDSSPVDGAHMHAHHRYVPRTILSLLIQAVPVFGNRSLLYHVRACVIQTSSTEEKSRKYCGRGVKRPCRKLWSGREDLNLRPPEPHSGALPDCATSRNRTPC